jgi:pimeloyl-ACP methyl ester carboxylesterase
MPEGHTIHRLAADHRVVTYDQPGHGRTDPPGSGRYDLDLLGDTFVEVVRATVPSGRFVVAGHSLGGMSLLNSVRRHPDLFRDRLAGVAMLATTSSARSERLTLEFGIRAAARLERGIRRLVPTLRDPRVVEVTDRLTAATSDLSYLVTRATAVGPDADPAIAAFTQQLALDSGTDVMVGLVEAVVGVDEDDALDTLAWLGAPTTVLVGSHDRLTPVDLSRRMARRCGGDLREIPGAGHMLPLEAPDEVSDVLRRYLDRTGGVAGSAA